MVNMAEASWTWLAVAAGIGVAVLHPEAISQVIQLLVYLLVLVNLLLGLAISVSWVSAPASLLLTETISSAVCRPLAALADLKVQADLSPRAAPFYAQPADEQFPLWVKQLIIASLLGSGHITDTSGVGCFLLYVVVRTLSSKGMDPKLFWYHFRSAPEVTFATVMTVLLAAALWSAPGSVQLVLALLYCAITEQLPLRTISSLDLGWVHDDACGQEVVLARGLLILAELGVSTAAILVGMLRGHCLILVAVLINIYLPLRALWREVVKPFQGARRALSGFRTATWREIRMHDDVCAICLSVIRSGRITPCQHIFHGKCLRRSLQEKKACPMCNKDLTRVIRSRQGRRFQARF